MPFIMAEPNSNISEVIARNPWDVFVIRKIRYP